MNGLPPSLEVAERALRHGELLVATAERARERRKEAVVGVHRLERLLPALCDVAEERAERRRPGRRDRHAAGDEPRRVHTGQETRRGGLDVALDADDLPGE